MSGGGLGKTVEVCSWWEWCRENNRNMGWCGGVGVGREDRNVVVGVVVVVL